MQVQVIRSGGFAAITQQAVVDAPELHPREQEELARLIETTAFFDLPDAIETPNGAMDQFHYEITVEAPERRHTVTVGDGGISPELYELARFVFLFGRRGA